VRTGRERRATSALPCIGRPHSATLGDRVTSVLIKDQQAFLDFVSGERSRIENALKELEARERGHFEDHPMSPKLVKAHLSALVALWHRNPVEGCRDWAFQFVADARVVDPSVKPLITSALADKSCTYLPTALYLMSTRTDLFADVGELLLPLASSPDREVRWRVAYVISKMKTLDTGMRQALRILRDDKDHTTQVYVEACKGIA